MGGNYKTVVSFQPKSIKESSNVESDPLEAATQIIINENSIRDYDVWARILQNYVNEAHAAYLPLS